MTKFLGGVGGAATTNDQPDKTSGIETPTVSEIDDLQ